MSNTFMEVNGIGRLGQDPDIRYTPSGAAVANFSVASDSGYKDKNGQWVEKTEWTRCVAWNKTAESIGEYLRKGSMVHITGRLETRKWDDKEGVTRYTTEVVISRIRFLADYGRADGASQGQGQSRRPEPPPYESPNNRPGDDDIPF
jgi:single-strand DNA-binding protein